MKMPDHNIGCSSSNNGYSGGNMSDSYDLDSDGYITPPNEGNSNGSPNFDEDFSEYMWMENEEEFDKQEMQRLEEEALMEQCIEAMLHDELEAAEESNAQTTLDVESSKDLCSALSSLQVAKDQKVSVEQSTLNPLAAEFVPSVLSSMSV